jgi:phage recombination protein Bet
VAQQCAVNPQELQDVLTKTILPTGSKPEHVTAFLAVAHQYGLNPLTREIYAFPAKGGGIQVILSVDGWNKLMNAHPQFDGIEFEHHRSEKGAVEAVTARIYRKDRTRPTEVTEYLAECNTGTPPWKQYPARMLRHAAMKQCIRLAFGLTGVAPEPEADEEPEPPKVINPQPETPSRAQQLYDQFSEASTPEEFEMARKLANAYFQRGDLSKADIAVIKEAQQDAQERLGLEDAK